MLSVSLTVEVDQDTLFGERFPSAARWLLLKMHSPKTQEARLVLLSRLDNVAIDAGKDSVLQLVEVESTPRMPRSYEDFGYFNDALVLSKFVNALPPEYDVRRR